MTSESKFCYYKKLYGYAKAGHAKLLFIELNKLSYQEKKYALSFTYTDKTDGLDIKNFENVNEMRPPEYIMNNSNYFFNRSNCQLTVLCEYLFEQETNIISIAAAHGHFNVINMVLTKFGCLLTDKSDEVVKNIKANSANPFSNSLVKDNYETSNISNLYIYKSSIFFNANYKISLALWYATIMGNLKIIKLLVEHGAQVDCEALDNIESNQNNSTDVNSYPNLFIYTCLMVACYKGYYLIADYLIMKGSKIWKRDQYGYTPLHYAAQKGHLDIIKLLLSSIYCNSYKTNNCHLKYDLNIDFAPSKSILNANNKKSYKIKELITNWQTKAHFTTCSQILINRTDGEPNLKKKLKGLCADQKVYDLPIHKSCMVSNRKVLDNSKIYILKDVMRPNKYGLTPLKLAAEFLHDDCVNYILNYQVTFNDNLANQLTGSNIIDLTELSCPSNSIYSNEEIIEVFELLAAGYVHDLNKHNLIKAKFYFLKAITQCLQTKLHRKYERVPIVEVSGNSFYKNSLQFESHPLFGERKECATIEECQRIISNSDELHIETLMILERIHGPYHNNYSLKLKNLGAKYAQNADFHKCLPFWIYSIEIDFICNQCINETLLKLIRIFSQMLTLDIDFKFEDFYALLFHSHKYLIYNMTIMKSMKLMDSSLSPDHIKIKDKIEETLLIVLYTVQLFTTFETNLRVGNVTLFKQKLYDILRLDARGKRGQTLLHFATDADTKVDEFFYMDELCKNPDPDTVELLIQCGANVDSDDDLGNTALHLAVVDLWSYNFPSSLRIVLALVRAEAHLDYFNHEGFSLLEDSNYPYNTNTNSQVDLGDLMNEMDEETIHHVSSAMNGLAPMPHQTARRRRRMRRPANHNGQNSSGEGTPTRRPSTLEGRESSDAISDEGPNRTIMMPSRLPALTRSPSSTSSSSELSNYHLEDMLSSGPGYHELFNEENGEGNISNNNFTQFPPIFSQVEVSLQCLAARCARKHRLSYGSSTTTAENSKIFLVPHDLKIFLDRHGPLL